MKIKISRTLLLLSVFLLSACGESESEIAKKIKLQVSTGAIVLPNKLAGAQSLDPGTCLDEDVTGPRIRLRTSIIWDGGVEYGNLIPYILQFSLENTPVGSYTGSIGPRGAFESMSYFFGLTTDFIPPDPNVIRTSSQCFADFGSLPSPSPKLTGRRELVVRAKLLLSGVTRTTIANTEKGAGVELPFVKEVETEIVYTAGSVPAAQ